MDIEQLYFSIIIPFYYDGDSNDTWIDEKISASDFTGALFKDEVANVEIYRDNITFAERYELCQKKRNSVGLQNNENKCFYFGRENIKINIGKIYLWVFDLGVSFLTIDVCAGEMNMETALKLVYEMCRLDDRSTAKLSYDKSISKTEKQHITIKMCELYNNFLNLDSLSSFKGAVEYSRLDLAYCMVYSYGEMDEQVHPFLSMLTDQNPNRRTGKEDSFCGYENYAPYLTFASGDKVFASYGRKKETLGADDNLRFISEKGRFVNSFFSNYRILYLYYLSVYFNCKKTDTIPNIAQNAPKEQNVFLNVRHFLDKNTNADLTNEEKINTLFRNYVFREGVNLDSLISKKLYSEKKAGNIVSETKSEKYDVFLSHASEDADAGREVVDFLEKEGKRVFFDQKTIPEKGSSEYTSSILNGLDNSRHFVVLFTDLKYIEKRWINYEMMTFHSEMLEGRKNKEVSNFIMLTTEETAKKIFSSNKVCLPLAYRSYDIITLDTYKDKILNYLK